MKRIERFGENQVIHRKNAMIFCFPGKRRVLSTGPIGSGLTEHLTAAFNLDMKDAHTGECRLRAPTYPEHMALVAEQELELDSDSVTGLGTAASMDHAAIRTKQYRAFTVSALVTAGVDVNGGRAGDPASWYEGEGDCAEITLGTVNIFLDINAGMTESALLQALMVCTEAKAAALQELLAPSIYSAGIATGSGTDGVVIIADAEAGLTLSDAGKHSKLGELIGLVVMEAVKEALFLETGLCPDGQHTALQRLKRFGVTGDSLWTAYQNRILKNRMSREAFERILQTLDRGNANVVYTSLYVHLEDQLGWGMLRQQEARRAAAVLLEKMDMVVPEQERNETKSEKEGLIADYVTGMLAKIIRIWEERT